MNKNNYIICMEKNNDDLKVTVILVLFVIVIALATYILV